MKIQDIADTFEGNFKGQNGLGSNWLPVNSAQVCLIRTTISVSIVLFYFILLFVCCTLYFHQPT